MTNKHEALRLADALKDERESREAAYGMRYPELEEAEAALRTQHALLERARESLKHATSFKSKKARDQHPDLIAAINQHLDQP